jgi:hypothetical protein
MKQRISDVNIGKIALITTFLLLLFLRFPDFFQTPNSKVIEAYGDGIKAYTVIEYHARYDSSLTWYEGMNYPYQEHVIPAATQPLISNTLKLISTYLYDVTPYTRAVIHFSLLLGLLLCAYFLYLIFIKLELPPWLSVGIAVGMAFLSPQLHRMTSHYGLAHPEVLPVILYLLLRLEEDRSWKTSAWIAVAVTAFSLIHFYYFAIITFTISFYFLFGFLRKPTASRLLRYAFHYSIQLIIPLVFFYFWMYHEDPVTDRTAQPWGFFYYKAIWEGIFTSMAQPHFQWIDQHVIKIETTQYEGQAYVGLVAALGSIWLFIRWIIGLGRQPLVRAGGKFQPFLNKILLAGLCMLFFSFCLPFSLQGMEWLADYAGPLRQFRSLGRFSWAFYYAINLAVFAELWHWLAEKKWKWVLLVPAVLLIGMEAYHHCYQYDLKLDEIKELKAGQQYTDIEGIDYDEFQAIVTVPYYNIGSDNFWYAGAGDILPRSQILSMQSGLPVTSAMLTRSSLSQTMKQIELILEPYRLPAILGEYPNEKPLLLMLSNYHYSQQKDKYEHLLEETQLLYDSGSYQLYRLSLPTFEKRLENRIRKIRYTLKNDTLSLRRHGDFLSRDSAHTFLYDGFDQQRADRTYRGEGGLQMAASDTRPIFDGAIPLQQEGGWYAFSVWAFLGADFYPRTWMSIIEYNEASGEEVNRQAVQAQQAVRVLDDGWGLLEMVYIPKRKDTRIKLVAENKDLKDAPLYFDELLVRPEVSDIYREESQYIFKNNRWFDL